jgi:hypothetical protein
VTEEVGSGPLCSFLKEDLVRKIRDSLITTVAVGLLAASGGGVSAQEGVPVSGPEAPAMAALAPRTSDDLLASFVTEDVEPGVIRVRNDGVGKLTRKIRSAESFNSVYIVVGTDSSVWQVGGDQLIKLGDDSVHAWPGDIPRLAIDEEFTVSADGVLWLSVPKARPSSFGPAHSSWRFDGESWEKLNLAPVNVVPSSGGLYGVEAHPSGTTYALAAAGVHLLGDGAPTLVSPLKDHGEAPGHPGRADLRIAEDGALWLVPENRLDFYRDSGRGWERIDDSGLQAQLPPEFSGVGIAEAQADVSPGGTIWAYISAGDDRSNMGGVLIDHVLARFDGSRWSTWGSADGVPELMFNAIEDSVVASADDSVWAVPVARDAAGERSCDGIVNFDGTTWTHYLGGRCVHDYDIALDGAAWVLAGDTRDRAKDPVSTYVIRPRQTPE